MLSYVRWFLSRAALPAGHDPRTNRVLVYAIGVPALVLGAVTLAPGWWWEATRRVGALATRHWLSILLFGLAATSFSVAARQRWHSASQSIRSAERAPINRRLPLFLHATGLLAIAVLTAVALGWLLWAALGQPDLAPQTLHPKRTPSAEAVPAGAWTPTNTFEAIKVVLAVVAGVGGVIALTVAYRKQDLGEAAEHREDTKLFTDRFGKASDQLGSDRAAVRLAGVYAMARLADDWHDNRQTCIDVLCAYLRMPTPCLPSQEGKTERRDLLLPHRFRRAQPRSKAISKEGARESDPEDEVRSTILRTIAGHLREDAQPSWQGHTFDFTSATLAEVDFADVVISEGTKLDFKAANLRNVFLNFRSLHLVGGDIDFIGAQFGAKSYINFDSSDFASGKIDFFMTALPEGSRFIFFGSNFRGAGLGFSHCQFDGGELLFSGSKFTDGYLDFSMPASWKHPPKFGDFPDGLPSVIHLPRTK